MKINNHRADPIYLFFLLLFTHECHAYIDPGTGSLILQSIIATVAVVLATGRMWWHRVVAFFSRKGDKNTIGDVASQPKPNATEDDR